MATRFTVKTRGRLAEAEAATRGDLARGDSRAALNTAIRTLQSELTKVRGRRPRDGALIDAELAAQILVLAAKVHEHRPVRPANCPPIPQPADMTRVFERALATALPTGESR